MSSIHRFLSSRDREKSKERKPHYLGRHHDRHNLHDHPGSSHTSLETASGQWTPDPSSAADFYGLFYTSDKPSGHSEEFKINNIRQQIINTKGVAIKDATTLWALRSRIANGDDHAAYRFLVSLSDASEGLITNYDPNIRMKGAINRQGVTCYLDATLFSMFSRLDSFEAMLYNSFPDRPRNKLSFLLRLWVNLIRTGQLVTVDITALIQNAIRDCGWPEAAELRQHDASEAFVFITGKLELPLLTLKMDIYHTGKEDASDDHKFINERLLDVAIPEDPTGRHTEITLEDCLEEYFNNRVEVKRYLERRSTLASIKNEVGSTSKGSPMHVEVAEIRSPSISGPTTSYSPPSRPSYKGRAQSIIQERYIPARDDGGLPSNLTNVDTHTTTRSRADSVRKEVLMPAWQFFSLIPWYTDNAPSNDAQVAAHFSSKRPMLGMCLKRYAFHNGRPVRLNTYVDIPVEIGLPHFIQDDQMSDDGALFGNFKLSLQAAVCHRGYSVESGHYVALVRSTPNTAMIPQWLRFDDIAPERVTPIDIYAALREETPYLLFYQILPIDGDPGGIITGEDSAKSQISLPLSHVSDPGFPSERPSFEVTVTVPAEDSGRDPGESRRQSVISITDGPKSDLGDTSSKLAPSRNLAEPDRSRASSKNRDSGIGRTLSKLKRRSKEQEPESEPHPTSQILRQPDHHIVDNTGTGPEVHVKEMSHSDSFPMDPKTQSKPANPDSRSAYQESRGMAAIQGYTFQQLGRNRSANRLSKQAKDKTKRPDRECVVM